MMRRLLFLTICFLWSSLLFASDHVDVDIDTDLSSVVVLLSELLVEVERSRELSQELSVQNQYQVGLLSFVCGVLLCFVFVFGLRFH